ncbi:hypothetical protein Clacol_009741 [Clathrus columnatus]|uniref:DUF676 domain-containing protein n=1 Tax=Clathrus columnatus TaxID=1419009 RepID=A0AAV5AS07_9AGAM|nr:hypothetical protein Clacol_009741 [Clathrus columnatus]
MTSICLSTTFVSLLRRLFNAFSAFSISQHYVNRKAVFGKTSDSSGEFERQNGQDHEKPQETNANGRHKTTESSTESFPDLNGSSETRDQSPQNKDTNGDTLKHNPQLFDSARAPRNPIVLCHGLYGFDVRGPESFPKLRMHYWSNVMNVLKKVGAAVVVTSVPGTGSISVRAERMDKFLQEKMKGKDINFVAHSMGGLDCRHLITHIKPQDYRPLSLMSLSVPHRGSPFMDWCMANIGIGYPRPFPFPSSTSSSSDPTHTRRRPVPYSLSSPLLGVIPNQNDVKQQSSDSSDTPSDESNSTSSYPSFTARLAALQSLPSSFTSLLLSLIDSPAYSNLTTSFLRDRFNQYTPDDPHVKYYSIAARVHKMSVWHPLWLPKLIVDAAEEMERQEEQQRESDFVSQMQSQGSEMTLSYPHSHNHSPQRAAPPRADSNAHTLDMNSSLRGNDGLVPISSAKWGTFLGVVDSCDHWELRGAGGLGGGSSKETNKSDHGNEKSGGGIGLNRIGLDFDWEARKVWKDWVGVIAGNSAEKEKAIKDQAKNEMESSPQSIHSAMSNVASSMNNPTLLPKPMILKGDTTWWTTANGFSDERRFDLEQFYVALCRKLYDEGL